MAGQGTGRAAPGDKRGLGRRKAEPPRELPAHERVAVAPGHPTHFDEKATAKERRKGKREAEQRLKRAESDLARLRRKEAAAKRRAERRRRSLDRRIERVERSAKRTAGPIVAALVVLNGLAAALALIHLFWPDTHIYHAIIYGPSEHWELVAFCYIGASAASVAALSRTPTMDFQQRGRYSLLLYFSTAVIIAMLGLLLAIALQPLETLEVAFLPGIYALLVILAVIGIPIPILSLAARMGRARLFFRRGYHRVQLVLSSVAAGSLVLLPILALAHYKLFTEVGLTMCTAGGLGMLFPLPGIATTFVAEYLLERRARLYALG